jgi:hypothetical protein
MANTPRTYNLTEYAEKARQALDKMRNEQKPGQTLTGGKKDVILSIKEDLKALIDEGYTTQQISEALKQDVFGILPKTITEIVSNRKPAVRKAKNKADTETNTSETKTKSAAKTASHQETPTPTLGTFSIKADKEDI